MQTNEQPRHQVAELQAGQQLSRLKNDELSSEAKMLHLKTTILNASVSNNNVNVDLKFRYVDLRGTLF